MTLHRFFLPTSCFDGRQVQFPRDVAHQIERVLRLRPGDLVVALDGSGLEHVVTLRSSRAGLVGSIETSQANTAEPAVELTLFQSLLKGSKLELVLQKGTEVGVSRFVPVRTARSVPHGRDPGRLDRDRKIVREAAEQSGRGRLPQVEPAIELSAALARAAAEGPVIFLWEEEHALRIRDLAPAAGGSVALFVGPEGGFTAEEAAQAREAGAAVVTLGRRTLRAETAAIVGAALVIDTFPEATL